MDKVSIDDLLGFIARCLANGMRPVDVLNEIVLSLNAFKYADNEKTDNEEDE